jgi:hypothetical protein
MEPVDLPVLAHRAGLLQKAITVEAWVEHRPIRLSVSLTLSLDRACIIHEGLSRNGGAPCDKREERDSRDM